jgi:hypothetical protein
VFEAPEITAEMEAHSLFVMSTGITVYSSLRIGSAYGGPINRLGFREELW